ncbi:hypothetical protein B0H13DRAFT_1941359 [Mycena leptocephala]|nr:hypothetical protein B0H13DRAFT_1941359 [Mycena leptocephala]
MPGVITVIAAVILIFLASTKQWRENRTAGHEVAVQISRLKLIATHLTRHEEDLLKELNRLGESTMEILSRPGYIWWKDSAEIAQTIDTLSAQTFRLAAEITEMRLTKKILEAINANNQHNFEHVRRMEHLLRLQISLVDPPDVAGGSGDE